MFIILLILAQGRCDWVEISQHHWTKPLRQTHPTLSTVSKITDFEKSTQKYSTVRKVTEIERSTKANRIYINHSLPKYKWNEDDAFGSDFDVRHVNLETSTTRNRPEENNRYITRETDDIRKTNKHKSKGVIAVVTRNEVNKIDKIQIMEDIKKGDRRVPNKGNVQKTQLSSSEKSLVRESLVDVYNNRPIEVMNLSDLDYAIAEDVFATVELSDDVTSVVKPGINKHMTAVGPALNEKSTGNKFSEINFPLDDDSIKDKDRNYAKKPAPKREFINNSFINIESDQTVSKKVKIENAISNTDKTLSNQLEQYSVVSKDTTPKPTTANEGGIQPYNKDIAYRFHNIGNVKRVQLPKSTERTPNDVQKPSKNNFIDNEQKNMNEPNSIKIIETIHREHENDSNINKANTPDKVKRVDMQMAEKIGTLRTGTNNTEHNIFEPIKKTVIPSPEEVMMEEILKEEEKLKDATRLGSNIGIIKRVKPNSNHMLIAEENTNVNKLNLPVKIPNVPHAYEDSEEITMIRNKQNIIKPLKHETTSVKATQELRDDKYEMAKRPIESNSKFIKAVPTSEDIIYNSESDQSLEHKTFANLYSRKNYDNSDINKLHASNTRNSDIANKQQAPLDNIKEFSNLSTGKVTKMDKFKELTTNSEAENHEHNYDSVKILHESKPEFVTKKEIFSTDKDLENEFIVTATNSDFNDDTIAAANNKSSSVDISEDRINPQVDKGNHFKSTPDLDSKQNMNQEGYDTTPEDTPADNTKAKSVESLIKFLKIVTDTISRNTKRTFIGKLQYLEDLRDILMDNIAERIDSAFPDDEFSSRRRSRSAQATTSRGHHVEFPSSESALMTISFLTFAVFLIKLVLQVIHTYKNKTMVMPGLVAAVGRAFAEPRSWKAN